MPSIFQGHEDSFSMASADPILPPLIPRRQEFGNVKSKRYSDYDFCFGGRDVLSCWWPLFAASGLAGWALKDQIMDT